MTGLSLAQLDALRTLSLAYPGSRIAIIGAAALAFHLDMKWRSTADLDLAIAVAVEDIEGARLPGWERKPHREQRWVAPKGVLIDLIPASAQALERGVLIWPATGFRMNLVGIRQALECEQVRIASGLSVVVASVPVIALLKMAAYLDRPHDREKDLKDLAHILDEYPDLDDDRIFDDESLATNLGLPNVKGFILGREMRVIADERDGRFVEDFLAGMGEGAHWSHFVENSPWRYDDRQLRGRLDGFRMGFAMREPEVAGVGHSAGAIAPTSK